MKTDEEICYEIAELIVRAVIGPDSHLIDQSRVARIAILIRQGISSEGYVRIVSMVGPSKTAVDAAIHPRLE